MQVRKSRIKKLEEVSNIKRWIAPKMVIKEGDGWETKEGVKLIEDGEKFLYEDGSIFFEPKEECSHLVEVIRIEYV